MKTKYFLERNVHRVMLAIKLYKDFLIAASYKGLGELLLFVFFAVAAKYSSASAFGSFASTFSIVLILSSVACFGAQNSIAKNCGVAMQNNIGYGAGYTNYRLLVTVLLLTGGGILLSQGSLVIVLLVSCYSISLILKEFFRVTGDFHKSELPFSICRTTPALVLILLWDDVGLEESLLVSFALMLIAYLIFYLLKFGFSEGLYVGPKGLREDLKESSVFGIQNILRVCLERGDVILAGVFLGVESAGAYAVITRVAILGNALVEPARAVLRPRLSKAIFFKDSDKIRVLNRQYTFILFAAVLPVLLIVSSFPQVILGLFGAEYQNLVVGLIIVTFSRSLASVFMPAAAYMNMSGAHVAYALILAAACVLGIFGVLLVDDLEGFVYVVALAWLVVALCPQLYLRCAI